MTNSERSRDSRDRMSRARASAKPPPSAGPSRVPKGSTASDGLAGTARSSGGWRSSVDRDCLRGRGDSARWCGCRAGALPSPPPAPHRGGGAPRRRRPDTGGWRRSAARRADMDPHQGAVRLLAGGIEGQPALGRRDATPSQSPCASQARSGGRRRRRRSARSGRARQPATCRSLPRRSPPRQQHAQRRVRRRCAGHRAYPRGPRRSTVSASTRSGRQGESDRVLVRMDQVAPCPLAEAAQSIRH